MIKLKSEEEIALARNAGKILSRIMDNVQKEVRPGVTTEELDQLSATLMKKFSVQPAFKGLRGFPANICTSINEEVVHGIPTKRALREGDIISLDIGIKLNGYFSDCAVTLPVGCISTREEKLIQVTRQALSRGIAQARAHNRLYDISFAIQSYVESFGFSVVRKFVGHGIGTDLHEEPEIPNFGIAHTGPELKVGMILAIEPMVNEGTADVVILDDGWTVVTKDRKLSAHFEHTVYISENGPQVLTEFTGT